MEKTELKPGDIVQLRPDHKFGGMLLVVIDPKYFGCSGYLMSEYNFDAVRFNEIAYILANFEDFEYVGRIQWINEGRPKNE